MRPNVLPEVMPFHMEILRPGRDSLFRRQNQGSAAANDLLQFQYRPPPRAEVPNNAANTTRRRNPPKHKNQRHQPSAQDRAAARRKAHALMFPLHASAHHSFALTRQPCGKATSQTSSFRGCDEPVSWESVRWVMERVVLTNTSPENATPTCPICLSPFVCPRITKCGHSFCLPCLLRHLHVSAQTNPYQACKCPCCGLGVLCV